MHHQLRQRWLILFIIFMLVAPLNGSFVTNAQDISGDIVFENLRRVSPDGSSVVWVSARNYGMEDTAIWLAEANGANARKIVSGGTDYWVSNPVWSPSSNKFAYIKVFNVTDAFGQIIPRIELWVFDLQSGSHSLLLPEIHSGLGRGGESQVTWTALGEITLENYSVYPSRQVTVDAETAQTLRELTADTPPAPPSGDIKLNVPAFSQLDSQWSSDQLGWCGGVTIGGSGCYITTVAMLLKYYKADINPKVYNTWLKNNGGYLDGCLLIHSVAANYPNPSNFHYAGSVGWNQQTAINELAAGRPTTVNGLNKSNIQHMVAVIGYVGGVIKVLDPACGCERNLNDVFNTLWNIHLYRGTPPSNPEMPPNQNVIQNGTFANGTQNWQFGGDLVYQVINQQLRIGHTSGTSYALLGQTAPYSIPSGSQVELSLDVGNSHNQPILLYVNFMDLVELRGANCIFSLPPNTPLKRYTLRGRLTRVFDAIRIEVGFVNGPNAIRDSQLHVALDNISLKRNSVITTEVKQCLPPKWGNDTIGIFRPADALFYLRNQNTTGPADIMVALGLSSDLPVSGDWDGDGIDTIGIYRQSTGVFYLKNANTFDAPIAYSFVLGNPGDVPFVGDWNGNGRDGVGVFRPTNGIIYMKDTLTTGFADYAMVYGIANDQPVAGDWNGNGKDSVGIYRGNTFFLTNQTCNNCIPTANYIFVLGNAGDVPFAGDWNANGTDGVGVFRPTNGITYFKNALTTGFADISMVYGIAGDRPIAGVWTTDPLLIPGKPTITQPTAGVTLTSNSVTFQATDATAQVEWQVDAQSGNFSNPIHQAIGSATHTATLADGSYKVRSRNRNGEAYSSWSNVVSFTVANPCNQVEDMGELVFGTGRGISSTCRPRRFLVKVPSTGRIMVDMQTSATTRTDQYIMRLTSDAAGNNVVRQVRPASTGWGPFWYAPTWQGGLTPGQTYYFWVIPNPGVTVQEFGIQLYGNWPVLAQGWAIETSSDIRYFATWWTGSITIGIDRIAGNVEYTAYVRTNNGSTLIATANSVNGKVRIPVNAGTAPTIVDVVVTSGSGSYRAGLVGGAGMPTTEELPELAPTFVPRN